jgi:hypothetical protein
MILYNPVTKRRVEVGTIIAHSYDFTGKFMVIELKACHDWVLCKPLDGPTKDAIDFRAHELGFRWLPVERLPKCTA